MTRRFDRDPDQDAAPPRHWEIILDRDFLPDLRYWMETDRRTAARLLTLMEAIARDPFEGVGNPEVLRHFGSDVWSRRLTQEHRIMYAVEGNRVTLLRARYHYPG